MHDHLDRRVRRTREALQEALLILILEKGYDALTVEEIAARADVGRTTFYLHYHDQDDLLLSITGEFAEAMQEEFLLRLDESAAGIEELVALLFDLAGENVELFRAIMSGRCGAQVLSQFQRILLTLFRRMLEAQSGREGGELRLPVGFAASYLFGALRESLMWWLDHRERFAAEQVLEMFTRLTAPRLGWLLGRAPSGLLASVPD